MMAALEKNGFDINNPDHHIVICGDLFDRGPDAVKCFEFVKKMADADRLMYIYGNHEELLQECVEEICIKRGVSPHHISNGTLDTLVQFTGMSKYDLCAGWIDTKDFCEKINPILEFIYDQSVDCGVFGDYIFVHGWIPCDPHTGKVEENWNTPDADWSAARWINGMSAWHKGARIQGKTIVCGHWNTSWGHSHLRQDRKEFPAKNRVDWEKSFVPFIDEGIIALDACTAYTGFCNCVVLEKI
jgi:serine/threonine protein phosphatase 1